MKTAEEWDLTDIYKTEKDYENSKKNIENKTKLAKLNFQN